MRARLALTVPFVLGLCPFAVAAGTLPALDRGGVTVVQLPADASYDRFVGSQANVAARVAVAQTFYGLPGHGDDYDLLVVATDFPVDLGDEVVGVYWPVRQSEEGIGLPPLDSGEAFGSARRLQGYVDLGERDPNLLDPGTPAYLEARRTFLHEMGHRYAAYANVADPARNLLGKDGEHWSYYLVNGGSFLYGSDWVEESPGTWVSLGSQKRYSDLDLYLMGLVPPSDVKPFLVLDAPGGDRTKLPPPAGTVVTGVTPRAVTIDDVIGKNGPRKPDAASSPKDLRATMLFLTRSDPASVPAATLAKLAGFGTALGGEYLDETGGRGSLEARLVTAPPPTGNTIDLAAALAWLRSRQKADGSFEDGSFTTMRDTSEAATSLVLDPSGASARAAALAYLAAQAPSSTDFLARAIAAQGSSAPASQISDLASRAGAEGGFGAGPLYAPDPLDTALARLALQQLQTPAGVRDVEYLLAAQAADGGFLAVSGGASRTAPTALVLRLLDIVPRDVVDPARLLLARGRAVTYLLGQQAEDGGIGDSPSTLYGTALAYEALRVADGVPAAALKSAEAYLAARQGADGSFGGSVYQTALVARLLSSTELPDLVLDAVQPAEVPFEDHPAGIYVTVRNAGGQPAPPTSVGLWDGDPVEGGIVIGTIASPALSPGAKAPVSFTWSVPKGAAGPHVLFAKVDADLLILEISEENNATSAKVEVLTFDADLLIESLTLSPNPAVPSQSVDATAMVRSLGNRAVPDALVTFRLGSDLLGSQHVSFPVPGSAAASVHFTAPPVPGDAIVSAVVDPADVVPEVDEANNVKLATLSVVASTLPNALVAPGDLAFDPPVGVTGQPETVTVTVHDTGTASIASLHVDLFLGDPDKGGKLVDAEDVAVPAGGSVPVALSFVAPRGAMQLVTVVLDGQNLVAESDETDNRASAVLPLSTAADLALSAADVTLDPAYPRTGQVVQIAVTVKNLGAGDAANFTVKAWQGADAATGTPILPDASFAGLPSGESAVASFTWSTAGLHGLVPLLFQVLPGGPDGDPLDNEAHVTAGLQDADFFAFTPYFSPNGDGILDQAAFGYRIPAGSKARITVESDPGGACLAELLDVRSGDTGIATWDGRRAGGFLAPDGRYRVIFEAIEPEGDTTLAILPVEIDTNRRRLSDLASQRTFLETGVVPCELGLAGDPGYGPDGTLYVPISLQSDPTKNGLYAIGAAFTPKQVLSVPEGAVAVDVAPDGRHAALGVADGSLSLLSLDASPPATVALAGAGSAASRAVFSHDGKRIAYAASGTLRLADVADPLSAMTVADLPTFTGAAFAPDDLSLFFGNGPLFRLALEPGAAPEPVLDPPDVTQPSWGYPQEVVGGSLLLSELSCPDGCAETGQFVLFNLDTLRAVPVTLPRGTVVGPSGDALSFQSQDVALGTLFGAPGSPIYRMAPDEVPWRGQIAFAADATRVVLPDALCDSSGGYVEARSLLNGAARLSYRYVADGLAVEVRATAADLNLASARLTYASSADPTKAVPLAPARSSSFVDKLLATFIPPADGLYQLRLAASDKAGNETTAAASFSYARPFPLRGLTIAPAYVSPGIADGTQDSLDIRFDVVATTTYRIEILDGSGASIRTYQSSSDPTPGIVVPWDGRNDAGMLAPDGRYRVRITADADTDPKSFALPEDPIDSFVVDNTPPALSASVSPPGQIQHCAGLLCESFLGVTVTKDEKDENLWPSGGPDDYAVATLEGATWAKSSFDLAGNRTAVLTTPVRRAFAAINAGDGALAYAFDKAPNAYEMYGGIDPSHVHPGLFIDLTLAPYVTIEQTWAGPADDFTVEARPVDDPDYAPIAAKVRRDSGQTSVVLSREDLPDALCYVRFTARDPDGRRWFTEDVRVNGRRTETCPARMLPSSHETSDSCPSDPPSFDRLLDTEGCAPGPVTYFARRRATGEPLTLGTAPLDAGGHAPFRWDTTGLAEGTYDVFTDQTGEGGAVPAHVDRTPPALALTWPEPDAVLCGAIPIVGCATDASALHVKVSWGTGTMPDEWHDLPSASCGTLAMFEPENLGLPGGTYTIRARAADDPEDVAKPYFCREQRVTFKVDGAVTIEDPLVVGAPFSPNGDGVKETVEIRYTFGEKIAASTVVKGPGGASVRTLEDAVAHDPAISATAVLGWDGLDDAGKPLPSATYAVAIHATDECGNEKTASALLDLDVLPPAASLLPSGSISPTCEVRGTATDSHFTAYEILLGQGLAPSTFTKMADGSSPVENGTLAVIATAGLSGDYVLRLHASDAAGNEATADQPLLFSDAGLITDLHADPALFSPNGDGLLDETNVRFGLAAQAQVTLAVEAPSGAITLLEDTRGPGSHVALWDGSALPDGEYAITLHAVPEPPAAPADRVASVTIDGTLPEVAITAPTISSIMPSSFDVYGTASDPHLQSYVLELRKSGEPFTIIASGQKSVTGEKLASLALSDGDYELRLTAVDRGKSEAQATVPFKVDATPPVSSLSSPADGTEHSPVLVSQIQVSGSASDQSLASFELRATWAGGDTLLASGSKSGPVQATLFIAWLPDGDLTLKLRAVDAAGNAADASVRIVIDGTSPSTILTAPANGAFLSGPTTITGTATDPGFASYTVAYTKAPATPESLFIPIVVGSQPVVDGKLADFIAIPPDGAYVLRLIAADKAGNLSAASVTITVDTVAPGPPILTGTAAGASYQLSWSGPADSDLAGFEIERDGQILTQSLVTSHSYVDTVDPTVPKTYRVRAEDLGGKKGPWSNAITLDGSGPEVLIASPAPSASVSGDVLVIGRAWAATGFLGYQVKVGQGIAPETFTLIKASSLPVGDGLLATWPTFGISEGPYVIRLAAQSTGGENTVDVPVVVDNTPGGKPNLSASIQGSDVTLTITATDESTVAFDLFRDGKLITGSGIPSIDGQATYLDAALPDGTYSYAAVALDPAGNQSPLSDPAAVAIDARRPTVRIIVPTEGSRFLESPLVIATSLDMDVTEVRLGFAPAGGAFTDFAKLATPPYEATWDVTGLPLGPYQLRAVACDALGCGDEAIANVLLEPAAIDLSGGSDGDAVMLAWTAFDHPALAGYRISRDGAAIATIAASEPRAFTDTGLPDGMHAYVVDAVDPSGGLIDSSNARQVPVWTPSLGRPMPAVTDRTMLTLKGKSMRAGTATLFAGSDGQSFADTGISGPSTFMGYKLEAPLPAGARFFLTRVSDEEGNRSKPSPVAVAIGEAPPDPPTDLATSVSGDTVTVTFVPAPEGRTLVYRDTALLSPEPTLPPASFASFAMSGGTGDPALAFDRDTTVAAWTGSFGDSFSATLDAPAFVRQLQLFVIDGTCPSVRFEADGPAGAPIPLTLPVTACGSTFVTFSAPFPVSTLRLVALEDVTVSEVLVIVDEPTADAFFVDAGVPAGLHSYTARTVAAWGTLSDPSEGATAQVGTALPLHSPILLFPASAEVAAEVEASRVAVVGIAEPATEVHLTQDGEPSGLAIARAAAGPRVELAAKAIPATPSLSFDGREVLFVKEGLGGPKAVRLDLATGETTPLLPGAETGAPAAALAAPMVLVTVTVSGQTDLALIDLRTGDLRTMTADAAVESSPSLDALGARAAFTSDDVVRVVRTSDGRVLREGPEAIGVTISANGSRIAFVTASGELYVAEAEDKAPPSYIAQGIDSADEIAIAPDGARVAYSSGAGNGIGLYVTDVDTGITTTIVAPGPATLRLPRFASSGRLLAYVRDDGASVVRLHDLESDTDRGIVTEPFDGFSARIYALSFGKDGRILYVFDGTLYQVEPPGRFEIPTFVDPGANIFTAVAVRTGSGDPPSPASAAATVTLVAIDAPDLVAATIEPQPEAPVAGEACRITGIVRNDGTLGSGPFAVDFRIRLQGVGKPLPIGPRQTVPDLAPGATVALYADLDTTGIAGKHEISIVADADGLVPEPREGNNTLAAPLRVAEHAGVDVATELSAPAARPGDVLGLSTLIVNAGPERDLHLEISFVDATGAPIGTIATKDLPAFEYGKEQTIDALYTVPSILPGPYAVATIVTANGSLVAQDKDPVTVLDSSGITASLHATRVLYEPGETIELDGAVQNDPGSPLQESLLARIAVIDDATGALRWSEERPLPPLPPGSGATFASLPGMPNAPSGSYTATLRIVRGADTLATAVAAFGIGGGAVTIAGTLQVTLPADVISFDYMVENGEPSEIVGATVRVLLFDPRDGSIKATLSEPRNLPANGSVTGSLLLARAGLPLMDYLAALQVEGVYEGNPFLAEIARERFTLADSTPPSLAVLSPKPSGVEPADVLLRASVTDAGSGVARVEALIDGHQGPMVLAYEQGSIYSAVWQAKAADEGAQTVTFQATDYAGNASAPVSIAFEIDVTPPAIVITGAADGQIYDDDFDVDVSVTDAHPGVTSVILNGATQEPPMHIAADGPYRLHVLATDLARNQSALSIAFRRDTAEPIARIDSPASGAAIQGKVDVTGTASDANLQDWTLAYHPEAAPEGAIAIAKGTTPVVSGLLGSFDATDLPDGAYVLTLDVRDVASRASHAEVTVRTSHGTLEIDKRIPFDARVLLWVGCGNGGNNCSPTTPTFIAGVLDADGIPYEVAASVHAFRESFRSGRFNIYLLYRPPAPNDTIYAELREAVFRGEGLIVVKEHPDAMPNLEGALGVQFKGALVRGQKVGVELLQSPISDPGIVQAAGDAITVDLSGSSAAAIFEAGGSPAATTFGFGLGRSVLFALDLEQGASPEMGNVLSRALSWVTPSAPALIVPGAAIPVAIDIGNESGQPLPFRLVETWATGPELLSAWPTPTSSSPLTWDGTVAGGSSKSLLYLLRLPAATGSFTLHSDLYLSGGILSLLRTKDLVVTVSDDRPALYGKLLAELDRLKAKYPGEAARIAKVRARVESAMKRPGGTDGDIEADISDLLKAASELVKVIAPIETARVELATTLRLEELRFATN